MQDMELIVFEIISNGGNAKALVYEAIEASENGKFKEARELLNEADTFLNKAHQVQTDLIQKEAAGERNEVTVLFVHAQDHLMTSIEVRTLAENIIRMNERIWKLENRE